MLETKPGVMSPFAYDADENTRQRMLLLGLFVAGKNAGVQETKLDQFLRIIARHSPASQFSHFARLVRYQSAQGNEGLLTALQQVKAGQYTRLLSALQAVIDLTLHGDIGWWDTISREELCKIPGMGMKTASFYLQFTRRGQRIACLDTHILAYMRDHSLAKNVPASTPTTRSRYLELEEAFLQHCEACQRVPAELDFEIWLNRSVTAKAHERRKEN